MGLGLGRRYGDSDTTFTSSPHAVNVPLTIYIGGIQAQIQSIPSYVLSASPAGSGGISLINQSNNQPLTASGLDLSMAVAETESSISVVFN